MTNRSLKAAADPISRFLNPLLWGVAGGCAVSAALLLGVAGIMAARDLPLGLIAGIGVAVAVMGCLAGGYISARRTRERGLFWGLLCSAVLFLLLFLGSLFLPGQTVTFLLPVKLFAMLLAGAMGGILGVNHRRRR